MVIGYCHYSDVRISTMMLETLSKSQVYCSTFNIIDVNTFIVNAHKMEDTKKLSHLYMAKDNLIIQSKKQIPITLLIGAK